MSDIGRQSSTKAHYENHSADSYESAFFYQPGAYTEHLSRLVRQRMNIENVQTKRVLLDIGGGTGNFTQMITKDTEVSAIVVDPFLEHSSESSDHLRFVKAPAEAFKLPSNSTDSWWRAGYHQVLMKEVVHHLDDEDRIPIFRGMWRGLVASNGDFPSLLIVTRPQHDIDYPLWDQARQVWARNQPSLEQFVRELSEAGFSGIHHSIEPYPCIISLKRWQSMIKSRFWSTFAEFSDQELEEACQAIADIEKHRIDKQGNLHFDDRLLFISAVKK